jgi:Mn-dependent DtxR family transcriptional regulator
MLAGITDRVFERMAQIYYIVKSQGCISTTKAMKKLGLSHSEVYHALTQLKKFGKVVEITLGKISLWCRDEETAKRTLDELASHVRRLLCSNGMKYATSTRVANLIVSDKQAFETFAKYVEFNMTKHASFKPTTLSFINALLQTVGDPVVRNDERSVYYVTCYAERGQTDMITVKQQE